MKRLGFLMHFLVMCTLRTPLSISSVAAQEQAVSVRLVNGSSFNEGRVEVYYRGQWGTVCDDGWDLDDANVICHMLGLPPAVLALGNAPFSEGSGLIALDDVSCQGNETNIADCRHRGWFNHNCDHSEDAGVICGGSTTIATSPVVVRLVNGTSSNEGRVEVNYQGLWGTVCDDGWDLNDANVICRMLGLPPATHALGSAPFSEGSGLIALDNVNCQGNETNIADCQHRAWFSHNCDHSEDAGVICGGNITIAPSPVVVRLVNGTFSNEGRVEVYYQGLWGTVCDDGWDLDDANVICRMLGLPPAVLALGNAPFSEGSGLIALDDVSCQGNESNIAGCRHRGWFNHNCEHSEDAGVICGGNTTITPSQVLVRLVGGTSSNEGRVEVYYQGQWGTVCDDEWDLDDANVVCRMLDLPPATHAWGDAHFGQASGPIALDDVNCYGFESSIADCRHGGWFSSDCWHFEDAGVTCGEITTTQMQITTTQTPGTGDVSNIRLDGDSPTQGTVQVWSNGQYVDLCSNDWDLNAVKVVCRQKGYQTNAVSVVYNSNNWGHYKAYLLSCSGNEDELSQCATPSASYSRKCKTATVNCSVYPGLSPGAVVGIAVSSALAVIGIAIIVVITLVRGSRRKQSQTSHSMNIPLTTAAQSPVSNPSSSRTLGFTYCAHGETSLAQPVSRRPQPPEYSTTISDQPQPTPSNQPSTWDRLYSPVGTSPIPNAEILPSRFSQMSCTLSPYPNVGPDPPPRDKSVQDSPVAQSPGSIEHGEWSEPIYETMLCSSISQ